MHGGVPPSAATIAVSAALVVTLTLAVLRALRYPYLAVGWFWFLGMLAPSIGLVQIGAHGYADRFTYLPAIGLSIATVWGVAALVAGVRAPGRHRLATALAMLPLAAYGVAAAWQTRVWRDSETLFRHTLAVQPAATLIRNSLASWYHVNGRPEQAIAEFREVVRRQPEYAEGAYMLGIAYQLEGRLEEATEQYRTAARLEPRKRKFRQRLEAVLALQRGARARPAP
jgi:tetratricopeptide (TPR) repeat protein